MNKRDELEKILNEHFDCSMQDAVDEIFSWHSRHGVKVYREDFKKVFHDGWDRHTRAKEDGEAMEAFERWIDDLLSLLNGEKVWCEHIKPRTDNHPGLMFDDGFRTITLIDHWTVCPICRKERPKDE